MISSSRTEKQRNRQTEKQTHTKVTTEGTLSGFQDFFLQPIIKDRPNDNNNMLDVFGIFEIQKIYYSEIQLYKVAQGKIISNNACLSNLGINT